MESTDTLATVLVDIQAFIVKMKSMNALQTRVKEAMNVLTG